MVLREESSQKERPQISKPKIILWTSTVSAPEMTIVLYGLDDLPLYHVSHMAIIVAHFNTPSSD